METDIATVRTELKEYRESITTELSALCGTVKGMEESLSACTDDVSCLQKEVHRLTAVADALQKKCDDLEARSRRNNVRIVGVPESQGCSPASVSALLKQAFDLKEAPLLDRAHRSLLPVPGRGSPPRVIVAHLHYYQDCTNILRLAREKQRIKMSGMNISVFPDYTAKTAKARAAFNDIRRQLREIEGMKFGILYPARLRITYQNVEKTFSTPEEAQTYITQNITGR
uniref:L1 transposable element RRM domain-containing protein n=1 Tax=Amphiprion ocellaris TaxID=80972 RepID=A0A3Q1C035_AMPOC